MKHCRRFTLVCPPRLGAHPLALSSPLWHYYRTSRYRRFQTPYYRRFLRITAGSEFFQIVKNSKICLKKRKKYFWKQPSDSFLLLLFFYALFAPQLNLQLNLCRWVSNLRCVASRAESFVLLIFSRVCIN